jgi:hypothetical protein
MTPSPTEIIEAEATRRHTFVDFLKAMATTDLERMQQLVGKAAVAGHSTVNSSALATLPGSAEFRGLIDRLTVIASLGINDPLATTVPVLTGSPSTYWRGEGKAKPATKFTFAGPKLDPFSVSAISVISDELLRNSRSGTDRRLLRQIANDSARTVNHAFLDPVNAGIAGVRPASITNGVVPIAATGTSPTAVVADIAVLIEAADAADCSIATSVLILSPAKALAAAIGSPMSGMTVAGGSFHGIKALATPDVGDDIVLVDPTGIALGYEDVEFAMSAQTVVEMLDNPTNDTITPTATTMTSMWQTDSRAIRSERICNWQPVRDGSVHIVAGRLS